MNDLQQLKLVILTTMWGVFLYGWIMNLNDSWFTYVLAVVVTIIILISPTKPK